ncbi:MAG TPA: hypothetical protein H9881_09470 [Candidatus Stackebrandtia excrementipullorum]|nr:hypothetical protein [Candidatus Stackebrandtia excrementipullorum]
MGVKRWMTGVAAGAVAAVAVLSPAASAKVSNMTVSPQTVAAGHDITITGACDNGSASATMWYGKLDSIGEPLVQLEQVDGDQNLISGILTITADTPPGSYLAVMQCDRDADELGTVQFNVAHGGTQSRGDSTAAGVDAILFAAGGMLLLAAMAGTFYYRHNSRA